MRKETKATAIPRSVKLAVWLRDSESCVLCHQPVGWECANAHIVRRSQGGRGIEKNIVTLCPKCHRETDEGRFAKINQQNLRTYIREFYPDWTEESVKYHKGGNNV